MRSMEQILEDIEARGVSSDIITELIAYHADDAARMYGLHQRYLATDTGVPVLTRTFEDENKVNNRINNDFFAEIVDTKVGYFAGTPIGYEVHRDAENHDAVREKIWEFRDRCHIPDMDAETAKMAAICGIGVRILYIAVDGEEAALNLYPWEVVFVTTGPIHASDYAMRYYQQQTADGLKWRVDWYDSLTVSSYIETEKGTFTLIEQRPHMFDLCPVIGFSNNEEHQGDAEKVLALIDGYDNTISDVNSEIEQFRMAYMAFYGYSPDEETIAAAKKTGAFGLDEDGKIEFITKEMQDTAIENHLDRIETNIYRFSKTPNFSDEAFAGSQSGEARKYKMLPFENKCVVAERKFSAALRRMLQVLTTAWEKKGLVFTYTDVDFVFKRNFPLDLRYEAETTALLRGHVSEKTRLGQLSFVNVPEDEIAEMQADAAAYSGGMLDLEDEDDETA